MSADAYPALADLIGAWFHQDFDLEGETISDVIAAFRAVASAAELGFGPTSRDSWPITSTISRRHS